MSYDVDFRQLMRTTRSTGQQHRLRYVPHPSANASKLASTASASAGRTQYQWETGLKRQRVAFSKLLALMLRFKFRDKDFGNQSISRKNTTCKGTNGNHQKDAQTRQLWHRPNNGPAHFILANRMVLVVFHPSWP